MKFALKITRLTVTVALMAILAMVIIIQFVKVEGWKSIVLLFPLLITVFIYRKIVCYKCKHQSCPFHFQSKGNFVGFWLPALIFFILAIALMFIYSIIFY